MHCVVLFSNKRLEMTFVVKFLDSAKAAAS